MLTRRRWIIRSTAKPSRCSSIPTRVSPTCMCTTDFINALGTTVKRQRTPMSAPFATPAPDDVQAELLLYLDAYSESLDHGLARYFGIEPLGLAGAPIVALKSAAAWTFLQKEGPGHEG